MSHSLYLSHSYDFLDSNFLEIQQQDKMIFRFSFMDLFESSTLKTLFDPPSGDLISGLESIQFKNLCPPEYHDLFIQLRRRSNLLTTTHIAHACYFVSLANRIK